MRKTIIAILCLVLMLALAVPAFAASASLSRSDSEVHRGDTFTVTVKISGADKCTAGSATIVASSALELTKVVSEDDNFAVDAKLAEGKVVFYTLSGGDINGKLLKLTFKVKSSAKFTDHSISVTLEINNQNITGKTSVEVTCKHSWGSWSEKSDEQHTRKCKTCGQVDTSGHDYDNPCDPDCNGCGHKREVSHNYATEWTADETGHWHACGNCGGQSDFAEHIPGEEAGEYTDQTCTECGFVLNQALGHEHRYEDAFQSDELGHWRNCSGCGEKDESSYALHGYDSDCDTACDACGYTRTVAHKPGQWVTDEAGHSQSCGDCGHMLIQGQHEWDAGFVQTAATESAEGLRVFHCKTCMAEKTEPIAKAVAPSSFLGLRWWAWLLIGFLGGAVIVGGGVTLVIVMGMKNKSKGKFAGSKA